MTLYELRELFVDESQDVRIFDCDSDADVVYEGEFKDMPEKFEDVEVSSIDNLFKGNDGFIGINVCLSECDWLDEEEYEYVD